MCSSRSALFHEGFDTGAMYSSAMYTRPAHLSRRRGEAIAGRASVYRGSHALPHVEVTAGNGGRSWQWQWCVSGRVWQCTASSDSA